MDPDIGPQSFCDRRQPVGTFAARQVSRKKDVDINLWRFSQIGRDKPIRINPVVDDLYRFFEVQVFLNQIRRVLAYSRHDEGSPYRQLCPDAQITGVVKALQPGTV